VDPKVVFEPFELGQPHGPAPPPPIVTETPEDGIGNDGNTFAPPAPPPEREPEPPPPDTINT